MSAPTRRALLGASAAAGAIAAVPVAALAGQGAGNPDAELIRVCARHAINMRAFNAGDEDGGPLWEEYSRTRDFISNTRARTLAGLLAKARVARVEAGNMDGDDTPGGMSEIWFSQIAYDLCRLAGDVVPEPKKEEAAASTAPPLVAEFPDLPLLHASADFIRAEAVLAETEWVTDNLTQRPSDRAGALARHEAAAAAQLAAGRILVTQAAHGPHGVLAKARAAVAWYGDAPPDDGIGADILWSLAKDAASDFGRSGGA